MKAKTREDVIVYVSVASFIIGTVLIFMGLFMPPKGDIQNSVLVGTGQFLSLTAGGLGIKQYIDGKYGSLNQDKE